jgi:hypothetical protein
MKLPKILDNLNSFEKNSFLKIIDTILSDKPKNQKLVDQLLSESPGDLKSMDNINISRVFHLLESEFQDYLRSELLKTSSQLDIAIDIITRDGNSIMKQDWFARLYEKELKTLNQKIKSFNENLLSEKSDFEESRKRDYLVYKNCLMVAFENDDDNNQDRKVTTDEQSILNMLSSQLGLSQEEIKLINYQIIPLKKLDIDDLINELKSIGVLFYSKKLNTVYVADEMVRTLRSIRGKEVADKYFRRVLKSLREPQINLICRKHGIDWKLDLDQKIKEIIQEGISFTGVFMEDIHKPGTKLIDKKKVFGEIVEKALKISNAMKGSLLEEKVASLINYFDELEKDEKIGISHDGYEKLILEIKSILPKVNPLLKKEFELQEEDVLVSSLLLDYNIKPRDVLELIPNQDLLVFCEKAEIKTRGDLIENILDGFKDAENLFLENYVNIAFRNISKLKENGILVKEAELGIKFEELTKSIFTQLGFNVDDSLRKKINTSKDKTDVLLNMGNNELILVECKTSKESGYNKFSSVSRQLKAYSNLAKVNDYKIIKSLLIAPEFSDEFVKDCGLDYELNLSLITAETLLNILEGFKVSKLKVFPHNLLMRDVKIEEDRIIKAITK